LKKTTVSVLMLVALLVGCARESKPPAVAGDDDQLEHTGDQIMVAGQLFHTGTPVVLWTDPGGYNAYQTEIQFTDQPDGAATPPATGSPERFGQRRTNDPALASRVQDHGWTLPDLQQQIDQFVIHYDAAGTSENCFNILHNKRGLSVHFMLDLDGTIYQTLDLQERAWHATKANDRSIGIEIANIGAYPPKKAEILDRWYTSDGFERQITLPARFGDGGLRTPEFIARPARPHAVVGQVQGQWLKAYDLTNEQYEALAKLTAALCRVFPEITCDYPRNPDGSLVTEVLDEETFASYKGLLGHFHVQKNKIDPGPAFDWDRVTKSARSLLGESRAGFSTRTGRSTGTHGRGGGSLSVSEHSQE
jgi:N-acetylmuramoyl-L-alanine amidase